MVEVPVRPPRFLGEKVPYREQTVKEQIESGLPGYTVEQTSSGYIARASPVKYVSERRGANRTTATYIPDELVISSEGQVLKETKRSTYKSDVFEHGQTQDVYESEVTDYQAQSRFTFGKRDLKSGRETIQRTSSNVGGQYKENRIIHQDSKEYEIAKEQHDLFQGFVNQGMSYAQARQLSRASEVQREAYFKGVARERTNMFSLQAKAQHIARNESQRLNMEVQASAQQYSQNIVRRQKEAKPKPVQTFSDPVLAKESSPIFKSTTSSPTTRTDMGDQFNVPSQKQSATMSENKDFYGKQNMVTSEKQYQRQQQLASDNPVQKVLDTGIFRLEETKLQESSSPFISEIVAPVGIGAGTIVLGTVAHPVQAVSSLLHPVKTFESIQANLGEMSATKGEVYATSYFGGQLIGGEVLGRAGGKAFEFAKDVYVKAGSEFVPPERVFGKQVLEEGKTFPTVRSTAEALERFNKEGKSYNVEVAQRIVSNPEQFVKATTDKRVQLRNPVLKDLQSVIPSDQLVYTGGVARKIITGKGVIRDVDVVVSDTMQGRELAYKVAERYPEKYQVIKHEKYPEIYRIREKKTGKVVVDFDPVAMAEEGQIKKVVVEEKLKPSEYAQRLVDTGHFKQGEFLKKVSSPFPYEYKPTEVLARISESDKPITVKTDTYPDIIKIGDYNIVSPEVQLKSKAMQILKGKTRGLKQGQNIQQLNPEIPIFKNEVVVSTVSPTSLKGKVVGAKVEKVGLEDSGIYVTPKGEASPYFTGIDVAPTEYSLNIFKGLGVPTVTEFSITKVTTYSREVLVKPGFIQLAEYQKANTGKGLAYITKRSMIGTGDLARQRFTLLEPTKMTGETVKAGPRVEAGTSEIEAVIGEGEQFQYTPKTIIGKVKGFDQYTTYKGRAVAIRQGKVLTTGVEALSPGSVVVGKETIKSGQESFGSLATGKKVVTPLSSAKAVPFGSLKTAKVVEARASVGSSRRAINFRSTQVLSSRQEVSKGSLTSFVGKVSAVSSNAKSKSSVVSVPSGISHERSVIRDLSRGGFSSGQSFGGSSGGGSSGKSGESIGSGSSRGGSTGRSYGAGQEIPKEIVRSYPKPTTEKKKKKGEFAVQVRSKGVFKTIAVKETPEEAFVFGKTRVQQTASASLRVKSINTPESVTSVGKRILPSKTFYESKKEPGVFIQKRGARISTSGEKREITFKGIIMSRNKNKGGLF
jgi:hypothetical protein